MRRVGGTKATRLTLGDLASCLNGQARCEAGRWGVRGQPRPWSSRAHRGEGPNEVDGVGAEHSTAGGDAEVKAETPERLREGGGGTSEALQSARQAAAAWDGTADSQARMTIEEVLRRENMLLAYQEVNSGSLGREGARARAALCERTAQRPPPRDLAGEGVGGESRAPVASPTRWVAGEGGVFRHGTRSKVHPATSASAARSAPAGDTNWNSRVQGRDGGVPWDAALWGCRDSMSTGGG